jgi:hypothetical protein
MPVLVNRATGAHEDLSAELAQKAISEQTHDVPLVSPDGQLGSAAYEDAPELLQQGYKQPTTEHLQGALDETKSQEPTEMLKAAAEGAAEAGTFGLSSGLESAVLHNEKDQLRRREHNEGSRMAGQAAGLIGSTLTGVGEGALLGRAAEAIVPAAETGLGRVGSAAAKSAIENMLFQSGDEASRMLISDPSQSAETALMNVGMSGLLGAGIGGGMGAASELWRIGPGKQLEGLLDSIKNRTRGVAPELAAKAGMDISPEMASALSGDPEMARHWALLQESDTGAGKAAQKTASEFRDSISKNTLDALGVNEEQVGNVHNWSNKEAGDYVKDELVTQLKKTVEPITDRYDQLAERFKAAPMDNVNKNDIYNKLSELLTGQEYGYAKQPDSKAFKLVNRTLKRLDLQENAQDLRNFARTLANENPFGTDGYFAAKQVRNILEGAQENIIRAHVGSKAPEVLGDFEATQQAYKGVKQTIDSLDEFLRPGGKHNGPASFSAAVRDMQPEDVISRLNVSKYANLQELLTEKFSSVADALKYSERNKLLKASFRQGEFSPKSLMTNLDKMSPEARQFALPPEAHDRLNALRQLIDRIPDKANTSGTAKTLVGLLGKLPESATALAAMLTGHNPAVGWVMGAVGKYMGRDVPDAAKLSMLKFLGSDLPTSSAGMKAAFDMVHNMVRGEAQLNGAVKAVFGAGTKLISEPTAKDRDKLKKQIDTAMTDPEKLMNIGGDVGHYLPDHGTAMSMAAVRNLQYLAQQRPSTAPLGPLDAERKPSAVAEAKYNKALDIAQNPLLVLKNLKDGSLTLQDMQHLSAMYPALKSRMQDKVMSQLMEHGSSGKTLPYKTKVSLSVFMGQPLSASMQPSSIQSIQASFAPIGAGSMQQPSPKQQGTQSGLNKLGKMPDSYATPYQARAMHRSTR